MKKRHVSPLTLRDVWEKLDKIDNRIKVTDTKQSNIQLGVLLITISISYLALGLAVLMVLFRQMATGVLVIVCLAVSFIFMVLAIWKPSWLFKKN